MDRISEIFYGAYTIVKDTLEIYGRYVEIPRTANGAALYTFDELCGVENPLGPADYLKLCEKYHTIVVQSVPQMDLGQKNEARRFFCF